MTDRFRVRSEDLQPLRVGPIGPHMESFAALLSQQGYCKANGWLKVRLVADLSQWLHRRQIALRELDETRTSVFLTARWKRIACCAGDQATMTLLLRHLRQVKAVTTSRPNAASGDIALISQDYEEFLLEERSLMRSSAELYLAVARRFFSYCFPTGKIYLARLCAQHVTDFVLNDTANFGHRTIQLAASALRSLLGFLFQKGRVAINLSSAVPRVASRNLAQLPRYLEKHQVEKVLRSCDRRRKVGKRDYAILLLLARLGLRAGEVVRLTLDDLDWHAGELLIRGKGARVDRLPLLQDVGQALADYLQKGRPECPSRRVFIQCKAPYEGFARPGSVSSLVRAALERAQLCPQNKGAHLLRHSLATGMLRNGASLAQIGQVLRHQLPQTTEIYAKVDLDTLRKLALPWLGGEL
jgi:site-specific recombinase XerD